MDQLETIRRLCLVGFFALTMTLVFAVSNASQARSVQDGATVVAAHGQVKVEGQSETARHGMAMSGLSAADAMSDDACPTDCSGGGACCGVIHCLTMLSGLPSSDTALSVTVTGDVKKPVAGCVPAGIGHAPDLRPPVAA